MTRSRVRTRARRITLGVLALVFPSPAHDSPSKAARASTSSTSVGSRPARSSATRDGGEGVAVSGTPPRAGSGERARTATATPRPVPASTALCHSSRRAQGRGELAQVTSPGSHDRASAGFSARGGRSGARRSAAEHRVEHVVVGLGERAHRALDLELALELAYAPREPRGRALLGRRVLARARELARRSPVRALRRRRRRRASPAPPAAMSAAASAAARSESTLSSRSRRAFASATACSAILTASCMRIASCTDVFVSAASTASRAAASAVAASSAAARSRARRSSRPRAQAAPQHRRFEPRGAGRSPRASRRDASRRDAPRPYSTACRGPSHQTRPAPWALRRRLGSFGRFGSLGPRAVRCADW